MENLAIKAAAVFAAEAHKGQKYGDQPYTLHLAKVFEVLNRFNVTDEEILVASWLHDVLEDTETSAFQIEAMFGRGVLDLVYRVTNETGKNRKERHDKTYPKIAESERATTLKLADRIANVEHSIETNNEIINMYKKEHSAFKTAVYRKDVCESMWRHLDFLIGEGNDKTAKQWQ